uniref:Alpha kinase putative n=1 Tax=Albugo laibachii Nc14 TaxID=890382 RepID=F0WNU1_9STRA|nr:alpha kinase putative [Albugo laibachii Nc14]|eukprot:CCA22984.1 alpha kinase putative [Albugo laibachii Nc14]
MERAMLHEAAPNDPLPIGNLTSMSSAVSSSSSSPNVSLPASTKKRRFRDAAVSSSASKNAQLASSCANRKSAVAMKANCLSASHSGTRNAFEKLNTLKLLLDAGHLNQEEYEARKTQLINEMTGTCADPKIPNHALLEMNVVRRLPQSTVNAEVVVQPLMHVVIPHNPPEFKRIISEHAEKLSFDVDTLEWHSMSTIVKIDVVPFATGQLRNAYYLQDLTGSSKNIETGHHEANTQLLVAKFMIQSADVSTYLSDVEMQAVCAHYARLYNEHEPPLKVDYAQSWLLKLKDRDGVVCCVEEYLPGAYVKYSNNNGFVGHATSATEERERNTPQAFSHFTFVASDYRLMVVDIQGVHDSYTDPQIHTFDGRGFGAGNLGTIGMEKFLQTHRCNEICKWLGLPVLIHAKNEKEDAEEDRGRYKAGGTAAPEYEMPFGNAIKKSTHRSGIEARNTFSKSVTVSEVLGEEFPLSEDDIVEPNRSLRGRRRRNEYSDESDSDSSGDDDLMCRTSSSFASTATTTRTTTASISAEEREYISNGFSGDFPRMQRRRRNALRVRKSAKKKMREERCQWSMDSRTDEEFDSSHSFRNRKSRKRNLCYGMPSSHPKRVAGTTNAAWNLFSDGKTASKCSQRISRWNESVTMDKIVDNSLSPSADLDLAIGKAQWKELQVQNEQLIASNSTLKQEIDGLIQEKEELFSYFQKQSDEQQGTISELEFVIEEHKKAICKSEDRMRESVSLVEDRDRLVGRLMAKVVRLKMDKEMAFMRAEDLENRFFYQTFQNRLELDHTIEKLCIRNRKYRPSQVIVPIPEEPKSDPSQLLAENMSSKAELTYQCREIEKLLLCVRNLEKTSQEAKKQVRVLELNEVEMSRKLFFSQKMVAHLQEKAAFLGRHSAVHAELLDTTSPNLAILDHEAEKLQRRDLETTLTALKDEREAWLVQQEELVHFFCQRIEEMTGKGAFGDDGCSPSLPHRMHSIDFWADETLCGMQRLLEKLRCDPTKVRRPEELHENCEPVGNRSLLERQLGMKLPSLPLTSPSKPGHPSSSPHSRNRSGFRMYDSNGSICAFRAGGRACSIAMQGASSPKKDVPKISRNGWKIDDELRL